MREIKFRLWIEDEKRMFLLDMIELQPDVSRMHVALFSDYIREQPQFIMQYTGLKDRNGVEIYEGDIVSASTSACETLIVSEIKFERGVFIFDNKGSEYDVEILGWFSGSITVIGNVHENPELLDGKD